VKVVKGGGARIAMKFLMVICRDLLNLGTQPALLLGRIKQASRYNMVFVSNTV
jgi:hypothetical protein